MRSIRVVFAMWAVMMIGMMTPSATPMILIYARVGRQEQPIATLPAHTGLVSYARPTSGARQSLNLLVEVSNIVHHGRPLGRRQAPSARNTSDTHLIQELRSGQRDMHLLLQQACLCAAVPHGVAQDAGGPRPRERNVQETPLLVE